MPFDFPAAPAVDEVYTHTPSGLAYVWDGAMWKPGTSAVTTPDPYVKRAGDTMLGTLFQPDPDPTVPLATAHKKYVDRIVAEQALYQGIWNVASNTPDLNVPPNAPLNGYTWTAQTVDPAIPEVAPVGIPGIEGNSVAALDTIRWNATLLEYEQIRGPTALSQMTIADTAPPAAFHGQQWWDSDAGKNYVYYIDANGDGYWVQTSGGGGGASTVTVSPTAPTPATAGMLWYDTTTGELNVYYDDGTTQQWVQTNVEEAPIDNQVYGRSNAGWVLGTSGGGGIPDAPNDGVQYSRGAPAAGGTNAWTALTASGGGIPEAPIDTKQYARQDAAWTEVVGGAGGGITEAPTDGQSYARRGSDATWQPTTTAVSGPPVVPVADAFPASPVNGQLHFLGTDASLYIWFVDSSSVGSWVEVSAL